MTAQSPAANIVFGDACLDALTAGAQAAARRRKNLNFHDRASHPAQRLLNAMEPDSYIQPHRHCEPPKDETLLVVRGAFGLVLFDDGGGVTQTAVLRAHGDGIGANIPPQVFHTVVSLESGSVFLEVKAGPYDPQGAKVPAPWAPPEDDARWRSYHARLRGLFKISDES